MEYPDDGRRSRNRGCAGVYRPLRRYLARTNRNVYLDTSWQVLQSPAILAECLTEWIGMVPPERITLSVDATNLEEYYGGQVMTRRILGRVLRRKVDNGEFSSSTATWIARCLLSGNVESLYFNG